MKKILILFLFTAQIVGAQNYFPFPTAHATWEEVFIGFIGSELENYNVMCGDTLIDGIVQSKVYYLNQGPDGEIYGTYYYGSIYEEDMKIWVNRGGDEPELLYDFTLEVGDTFPIYSSYHMVVESIGEINVNGELRKTIFFEPYIGWYRDEFWISGIGSNFGLFNRGAFGADLDPWTKCFKENEVIIYNFDPDVNDCDFTFSSEECDVLNGAFSVKRNDFVTTIYPNPFADKTIISFGEKFIQHGTLTLFNLQGQLLEKRQFAGNNLELERGNLPAGLLIFKIQDKNGKISTGKLVVK